MTSIQKFLRHKKLNTSMVYAYAHYQTLENDYFAVMQRIEQRLELVDQPTRISLPVSAPERCQLLSLAEKLFVPELTVEMRLEIALQMQVLLVDPSAWIPPPALKESEITLP